MTSQNIIDFSVKSNAPLFSPNYKENSPEFEKEIGFFGKLIRDYIYYPFYQLDKGKNDKNLKMLAYEESYYRNFWMGTEPKDLNLVGADLIRNEYTVYDQPVIIFDVNGNRITNVCRIIESKNCPKEAFNTLLLPGSLSTLDNNLFAFYDLLAAHSKLNKNLPARFIVWGYYELTISTGSNTPKIFKPANFDAIGEIIKRTLQALRNHFGQFDLISAHSAGCFHLASLLKRSGPELLPSMLHFDRGPFSIYNVSRHYWCGGLLYAITKRNEMTIDVSKEIQSFFDRCFSQNFANAQKSTCLITGVLEDYVYPDSAGLASSDCLEGYEKQLKCAKWIFNPPAQIVHPRAHHNLRLSFLNKNYLSSVGNIDMLATENLSEALIRLSHKR